MKITYDKTTDAAYIKLNSKSAYQASRKVAKGVLIDYAKDGTVVGIEILDASKNMPQSVNPGTDMKIFQGKRAKIVKNIPDRLKGLAGESLRQAAASAWTGSL